MRKLVSTVIALTSVLGAGAAIAQNYAAQPLYGTLTLTGGFTPDPQSLSVQAGGSQAVSSLGVPAETAYGPCRGYVAAGQPDARVNYTPGGFPLSFYVISAADTILMVNMPDTTWACNDDSTYGLNPQLTFPAPQGGQYDIWVGTYNAGPVQPATFFVTELPASNHP